MAHARAAWNVLLKDFRPQRLLSVHPCSLYNPAVRLVGGPHVRTKQTERMPSVTEMDQVLSICCVWLRLSVSAVCSLQLHAYMRESCREPCVHAARARRYRGAALARPQLAVCCFPAA
jgi:hypothetical protein